MYVVLMGPPGAGKTYLGRLIAKNLGFSFTETERDLIERYRSREAFVANKTSALAEIETELRARASCSRVPTLVESTGLSDRDMLARLAREQTLLLVKVWAPSTTCVQRVATRKRGRNLTNDLDETRRFHEFWARQVAPQYDFDLEVVNDGDSDHKIVAGVSALVKERS